MSCELTPIQLYITKNPGLENLIRAHNQRHADRARIVLGAAHR